MSTIDPPLSRRSHVRRLLSVAALGCLLASVAACTTPGSVTTESVGTIRTGINTAREQSQLAFDTANHLAREQTIERKVDDTRAVSLAESDFPLAVAPAQIAEWAIVFSVLDGYASALQKLVDPKLSQGTGDAIQGLGEQLQNGQAINAKLPSGVAGVFATFGQALVNARAEKRAIDVMRRVSPEFNEVTTGMADAIGVNDLSGLRGTVHGNWDAVLARIRDGFADTPGANRDARRRAIQQFVEALNARDAQLASLDQLRTSLLALGEAHAAAGRGDHAEAVFWIERIDGWLDDVRNRTQAIEKAHDEAVKAQKTAAN